MAADSNSNSIAKRMLIMLICVSLLFGFIFSIPFFKAQQAQKAFAANAAPATAVSAITANYQSWQPQFKAAGSLRAIKGLDVTTEIAGMVRTIYFNPGQAVKEGDLLVELNIDADMAKLLSLKADANLAKITYNRDSAQYAINAISKATLDADEATLQSKQADALAQEAIVDKQIIRAPFAGRLGISAVNPGQYLNPGDKIVTLQSLNPIYVDFYAPQQELAKLKIGQSIQLYADTYPNKTFPGKISTIDAQVDATTRNVQVEATIENPNSELLPGMFGNVVVDVEAPQSYITLPQSAISFNPYGDVVYIVKKPEMTVMQRFVKLGETRGDQVAVLSGIKEGETVVTSGQLKLKNGSLIAIDNKIAPSDSASPDVPNDH